MLLFVVLFPCWTNQVLSQCACNSTQCSCSSAGKEEFAVLVQGVSGAEGVSGDPGQRGDSGDPGVPGCRGPPGKTDKNDLEREFTKCDMYSTSWRRVVYINMTDPTNRCPSGLHEVNDTTNRACGKSVNESCTNLTFPTGWSYTHVCGRVRGYHSVITGAFLEKNISNSYVKGEILITHGSTHRHLWTYAVIASKMTENFCSTEKNQNIFTSIPNVVGKDTYCESKQVDTNTNNIFWNDPLWEKGGRITSDLTSCPGIRSGWFLKQVQHSNDHIEVRWCAIGGDVVTDIVEIWVQ